MFHIQVLQVMVDYSIVLIVLLVVVPLPLIFSTNYFSYYTLMAFTAPFEIRTGITVSAQLVTV